MLGFLRKIVRAVVGDYHFFKIYRCDLTDAEGAPESGCIMTRTPEPDGTGSGNPVEAFNFAYEEEGKQLCNCGIWCGDYYRRKRNFWPLQPGEAKLVFLETDPEARGRGLAPKLIRFAMSEMHKRGFTRLYARIWHSNKPSLRALGKAGWQYHALVVEFDLFGRRRLVFRK